MKRLCIIALCFANSIQIFGTTPLVDTKYYIHDNENTVYLEMTVEEIIDLLGEPDSKEVTKVDDTLHDNDIICLKYNGIQVSYYDVANNIILKIAIPDNNSKYMLDKKKLNEINIDYAVLKYGKPDFIIEEQFYSYYQYDIIPYRKYPHTFILQLKFNSDNICTELIFIRDDF